MNPDGHLHILQQGVGEWNRWRQENPQVKPRLSCADLRGLDLRGVDWVNADLTNALLRDADLRGGVLSGAVFRYADLSGANLQEVDLSAAIFCYADLSEARLSGTNLCYADLTRATLPNADARRARLREACLNGAVLRGSRFAHADLREAELAGVDARETDFSDACLCNADLTRADFGRARLPRAKLMAAYLQKVNFSDSTLPFADLQGAHLCGTNLSNAVLWGSTLQKADCSEGIFRGADLRSARLISTNCTAADFRDAILTGAMLHDIQTRDWHIDGVRCDYFFTDPAGRERVPAAGTLSAHDFERHYQSAAALELQLPPGLSPLGVATVALGVQQLQEKHPGWNVRIHSFQLAGLAPRLIVGLADTAPAAAVRAVLQDILAQLRKQAPGTASQIRTALSRNWQEVNRNSGKQNHAQGGRMVASAEKTKNAAPVPSGKSR